MERNKNKINQTGKNVRKESVTCNRFVSPKVPIFMLSTDLCTLSTGFIPQAAPSFLELSTICHIYES